MRQVNWQERTAVIIMKGLKGIKNVCKLFLKIPLVWRTSLIAGFIFLAFHFGHWWISLFSILFAFSYSEEKEE